MRWLLALACLPCLAGVEVLLAAPLATIVRLPTPSGPGGRVVEAMLTIPADAPADLGVGAFACDAHGRWFQRLHPVRLRPGRQRLAIPLDPQAGVEAAGGAFTPSDAVTARGGGLFFWSSTGSRARLLVEELRSRPLDHPAASAERLEDLVLPGGPVRTGERLEWTCRPRPLPDAPYDPAGFSIDLLVTTPAGRDLRLPGFWHEPMRINDVGDREETLPSSVPRYALRFRPGEPGRHRVRLALRWQDGPERQVELPTLQVEGGAWDAYARVDARDPRFFSQAGGFLWPIAINLRGGSDRRSQERLGTRPTPDRKVASYRAWFARLAAHRVDTVEIWLSAWGLGLEWRAGPDGFHGIGRYHAGHAAQLDAVLDAAWAEGIRCILVLNHHGQWSEWVDSEWMANPYHQRHGGWLTRASGLLTDERVEASLDRLRRYLAGRYADHPGVFAWKLITEADFVGTNRDHMRLTEEQRTWHERSAARWRALDMYGHPICGHWSQNWERVAPQVADLPGISFLCIDAYQMSREPLAALLTASTQGRPGSRALKSYGKLVLVTEYGGSSSAAPSPILAAQLAAAPWIALVSGHGGMPMFWWYEWVDQGSRFGSYRALAGFLEGEDLRDPQGSSTAFRVPGLTVRAWSRPGRILGHLLDAGWLATGDEGRQQEGAKVLIAEQVGAGPMTIAWWDAEQGAERERSVFVHPGGRLELPVPAFRRQLAFKLWRSASAAGVQ